MDDEDTIMSEEPLPGWQRFEKKGEKPWFKTPVPRMVIRSNTQLQTFLAKQHDQGQMLDISGKEFSFKRKYGLRRASSFIEPNVQSCSSPCDVPSSNGQGQESIVERLTRNLEPIDHRKVLSNSAKKVDQFREKDVYATPENFNEIVASIATSSDLRDMLAKLNNSSQVNDALNLMFSDSCLSELSRLNMSSGPLVDFPTNVNRNHYCKIVEQAMEECPNLLMFVVNMVTRRCEPVLPSHVLKIATLFSTICYASNQNFASMIKQRSLSLQVDGLSNVALDMLSDVGLTQCARSISNLRDQLADVGPEVLDATASMFPFQSTIDNCDLQREHLTVETIEKVCIHKGLFN